MTNRALIFGAALGAMLLTANAAVTVTPKSPAEARKPRVQNKTVQQLLRQHFVRNWKQMTLKEKNKMTSELSRIVADPENHVSRPQSVKDAMKLLGDLRSLEGIDVLVEYIGFPKVHHPDAGEYSGPAPSGKDKPVPKRFPGGAERRARRFPAVPALINIGPQCIDAVIVKLSSTDSLVEHLLCTDVLKGLHDDSINKKLEQAIPKTLPRRRFALRKALEALDEKPASRKK